jgi:hypothetical protein
MCKSIELTPPPCQARGSVQFLQLSVLATATDEESSPGQGAGREQCSAGRDPGVGELELDRGGRGGLGLRVPGPAEAEAGVGPESEAAVNGRAGAVHSLESQVRHRDPGVSSAAAEPQGMREKMMAMRRDAATVKRVAVLVVLMC